MNIDIKEISAKLRERDDAYIEEMSAYIQKIGNLTKQEAIEALIRTNVIKNDIEESVNEHRIQHITSES